MTPHQKLYHPLCHLQGVMGHRHSSTIRSVSVRAENGKKRQKFAKCWQIFEKKTQIFYSKIRSFMIGTTMCFLKILKIQKICEKSTKLDEF